MDDTWMRRRYVCKYGHLRSTFLANGNFQLAGKSASVPPNPVCNGNATYNTSEAREMRIMMIIAKSRHEAKLEKRVGQRGPTSGLGVMCSELWMDVWRSHAHCSTEVFRDVRLV